MSAIQQVLAAYAASATADNSSDWFDIVTWTGNGSGNHVATSLDLDTDGGMVIVKRRDSTGNATVYFKSASGGTVYNFSFANTTAAGSASGATLDVTGFSVPDNTNTATYVAWVFKPKANYFNITTWTGNGVTGRTVAHGLGQTPGFMFTCPLSGTKINYVQQIDRGGTRNWRIDASVAESTSSQQWNDTTMDASVFTLGSSTLVNGNTVPFAAFLWGDNDQVSSGTYTTNAGSNALPVGLYTKFILLKISATQGWYAFDTTRGPASWSGNENSLVLNTASAESSVTNYIDSADSTTITLTSSSAINPAGALVGIWLAVAKP